MKKALALAARARGRTSPNPMVGAVIVKNGRIIAEGFHRKAGTPHAEAIALERAGRAAAGSVLYVTLEPCCHLDKRTPPCTGKIIESGIRAVVVAMQDPNPKVAGKGIAVLRKAGIEVTTGMLEENARALNEAYIKFITARRPFVILKVAMTLDGKIATPDGESKWITGEKARALVHRIRGQVDAIMTGIGTAAADNPRLTCRTGGRNPLRIVVDPELKLDPQSCLAQTPPATIVVTRRADGRAAAKRKAELLARGVQFIEHGASRADLGELMHELGKREIVSLLVEAGSSFNASCLEAGIVDKIMIFIAPKIMGGKESYPAVGGKTFRRLSDALRIRDMRARKIGDDLLVEGYLK